jgi:hypothetical protein
LRTLTLLIGLTHFAAVPIVASGAVVQDTVSVLTGEWSFHRGDCGCPPCLEPCGLHYNSYFDVAVAFIFDPPLGHMLITYAGGQPLGNVPLDDVLQAPLDGYQSRISADLNEEFAPNRTYAIRTRDGGHAIIRTLTVNAFAGGFSFIYKYQGDGSGSFAPSLTGSSPIRESTWGKLKLLARSLE